MQRFALLPSGTHQPSFGCWPVIMVLSEILSVLTVVAITTRVVYLHYKNIRAMDLPAAQRAYQPLEGL